MDFFTDNNLDVASSCGGILSCLWELLTPRKPPKAPPILSWNVLGSGAQYLIFAFNLLSLQLSEKKMGVKMGSILKIHVRTVDAPCCYRP